MKNSIEKAASAYRSTAWWAGGHSRADVVALLAVGEDISGFGGPDWRGLDIAVSLLEEDAEVDGSIREAEEAMDAYEGYACLEYGDETDAALREVAARVLSNATAVLEAVVAANRRGDPDLWELDQAVAEVGMQVRYDRQFGELEIRRRGRKLLTAWHDRSNDEWLRASCDGTQYRGELSDLDQKASGLRWATSGRLSDLGGMGVPTYDTPLEAIGGVARLRELAAQGDEDERERAEDEAWERQLLANA